MTFRKSYLVSKERRSSQQWFKNLEKRLPLMLLTVWNREKDMIKVRSYIKKMFYYLRNVCMIFYSSKTISNKWWAGLIKQVPQMSERSLQRLHIRGITPVRVAPHPSHVQDERLFLHENFTAAWWGEAGRARAGVFYRFCQKCLYANDSMSDNLQSQLLISKPPDSMSLFILGTFNTTVFYCVNNAVPSNRKKELNCLFLSFPFTEQE